MFFYLQMRRKMKKYQIIYKDLEKAIHEQKYQVGDFLPTEQELVQSYQVSRDTIRKALTLLVEEGLVKKIHGSGSQVINQEQINFPVSDLTSYQELIEQQSLNSQTNVISLDKIIVDSKLSERTGFSNSRQVWRVVRQRVVDSCASVIDIDYLDASLVPQLNRSIAEYSIYDYIENQLNLSISHAFKEITIDNAIDQDKILIDLGKDQHVVCVRSKVYLNNGKQFQFTESRHKLEKFKFVDYAKRHH
jgi:GntR family trehalose operon transcriptional repressor